MITQAFLQEYFRQHDSITLYKPDGTPVIISKRNRLVLCGGHGWFTFESYEDLTAFYNKHDLCLKPIITIS